MPTIHTLGFRSQVLHDGVEVVDRHQILNGSMTRTSDRRLDHACTLSFSSLSHVASFGFTDVMGAQIRSLGL